MFRMNLPGNLKTKKIILYILVLICVGILIKTYMENKKDNINHKSTNVEIHMDNK
ncbi:MAG: hypothetical protein RSD13_01775 [Clostridium sp.]|uniref:hypothetical protein n=1 Tax=Clostridium sp. TaxID=1506 RepID=UPI002FC8F3D4